MEELSAKIRPVMEHAAECWHWFTTGNTIGREGGQRLDAVFILYVDELLLGLGEGVWSEATPLAGRRRGERGTRGYEEPV